MPNRSRDWLNQAKRDMEQAHESHAAGRHEWACFAAQQSAEKSVKALHLRLGQEAWGHMVAKLLTELPSSVSVPDALIDKARFLDSTYIPARYPNGHPEGSPFEHYGPLNSEQAIQHAGEIIAFVDSHMA